MKLPGSRAPTFLSTISRDGLSSVHRGTLFERRAQLVLQQHLSMTLRRVGGKDDGGIDLQGWWWLPPLKSLSFTNTDALRAEDAVADSQSRNSPRATRIRVLAQCKAESKKIGPKYVREMEGVLHRHIHASKLARNFSPSEGSEIKCVNPTVALLVSASPFTKAAVLYAYSSPLPFLLLHLPLSPSVPFIAEEASIPPTSPELLSPDVTEITSDHHLGSVLWNPALGGVQGLLRGQLELRWERSAISAMQSDNLSTSADSNGSTGSVAGRPGLWWEGRRIANCVPAEFISWRNP